MTDKTSEQSPASLYPEIEPSDRDLEISEWLAAVGPAGINEMIEKFIEGIYDVDPGLVECKKFWSNAQYARLPAELAVVGKTTLNLGVDDVSPGRLAEAFNLAKAGTLEFGAMIVRAVGGEMPGLVAETANGWVILRVWEDQIWMNLSPATPRTNH